MLSVLSPPGLLLLCEAVRAGVLADPHGPVCQLPGNGFANAVGAPWSRGLLWDRAGILGAASSGKLGSLLEKQNHAEPSAVACPV